MILNNNFSELCYAINGNMAYNETINIIFILSDINYSSRTACQNCTLKYGIPKGNTVPSGYLPINLHKNGDLYLIAGYYQIIDYIRTAELNMNINIYITDINSISQNLEQPVIEKLFKLTLKKHALELKNHITSYFCDPQHQYQSFPLNQYCDLELITEPLSIDFKSIIHVGDFVRKNKHKAFFKACLEKRVIVRDVDILRQNMHFNIDDHMQLSLKICEPEYQLETYNGLIPSEAGEFITHHKNVIMGFLNAKNQPSYLYFNKDYINPIEYVNQLYNFISIYMNKVEQITVKSPILYAVPSQNKAPSMIRAFIYDNKILPAGLAWTHDPRFMNISLQPKFMNMQLEFHSLDALKMIKQTKDKTTKTLPFRFYAIDYYKTKDALKISGIRGLKTIDMGLIASLIDRNTLKLDQYIYDHSTYKQYVQQFDIVTSLIDCLIVPQLKDLMHGFARNKYLLKA